MFYTERERERDRKRERERGRREKEERGKFGLKKVLAIYFELKTWGTCRITK